MSEQKCGYVYTDHDGYSLGKLRQKLDKLLCPRQLVYSTRS